MDELFNDMDDWDLQFEKEVGYLPEFSRIIVRREMMTKYATMLGQSMNNPNPYYNQQASQQQALQAQLGGLGMGNQQQQMMGSIRGPYTSLMAPGLRALIGGVVDPQKDD